MDMVHYKSESAERMAFYGKNEKKRQILSGSGDLQSGGTGSLGCGEYVF
jgi:hypothetical protein